MRRSLAARSRTALNYTARATPQEHEELRLAELFAASVGQNMGIIAASALLSFGGVASSPGVPPNHKQIWYNAGIQVGRGCAPDIPGRGCARLVCDGGGGCTT